MRTSLVAQTVKRLSTRQETQVQSLGREDPLEKEKAIHSSTIAWKIPWTEEPGRLPVVHGVARSRTRLSDFTHSLFIHPGGFGEEFYSNSTRVGLLIRIWVCAGSKFL